MIIFLPSFKRSKIIETIISSIIKADINLIKERILLLVHNNDISSKNKLEELLSKIEFPNSFTVELFNRKYSSLTPLENWFDCIFRFAKNNETVIMLGDDDLLLPWGLENRFKFINDHKADFLLSPFFQKVYFLNNGSKLIKTEEFSKRINLPKLKLEKWDLRISEHNNTTFVSSHCFRNTEIFRKSLRLSMDISRKFDWAIIDYSMGLSPSYLPYIINELGGKVLYCNQKPVIRGALFEEALKHDYADGGCICYYSIIGYCTFRYLQSKSKFDYTKILNNYSKSIKSRALDFLIKPKLGYKNNFEAFKLSGIKYSEIISINSIKNLIIKLLPFLRGIRLRIYLLLNIKIQYTKNLIENLNSISESNK